MLSSPCECASIITHLGSFRRLEKNARIRTKTNDMQREWLTGERSGTSGYSPEHCIMNSKPLELTLNRHRTWTRIQHGDNPRYNPALHNGDYYWVDEGLMEPNLQSTLSHNGADFPTYISNACCRRLFR